jgi:16S rRNA (uracil1498-N3)-methyltransferase
MPRFFMEEAPESCLFGENLTITGGDAAHIARVLRMKSGEKLTVCNCHGLDYNCEIIEARSEVVTLRILEKQSTMSEPDVNVTLYQGMTKGDKMDLIVQKSVELGVSRIVPVDTARSVSKPDEKSLAKKIERWNRIAAEAAGQSGRGILPEVLPAVGFETAIEMMANHNIALLLYEQNGGTLREHFSVEKPLSVGIMVGPEGGFEASEADFARNHGIATAGMGPRILRTETAPICALSVIMYATGNL